MALNGMYQSNCMDSFNTILCVLFWILNVLGHIDFLYWSEAEIFFEIPYFVFCIRKSCRFGMP